MPLYEYRCSKCEEKFEEVTSFKAAHEDKGEPCPKCGEVGQRVAMSRTSDPVFHGKGFFAVDYKKKTSTPS